MTNTNLEEETIVDINIGNNKAYDKIDIYKKQKF